MDQRRTDFLPDEVKAVDLGGWAHILPARYRVLDANLLADIFLAEDTGVIHMLKVSAGSIARIAASEREFRERCIDDDDGWLLGPLIAQCRAAGIIPSAVQCYAFTTLPLFGGEYKVANIWLCSWSEWISYTASMYAQTKGLPNGSSVLSKVVD